MKFLKRFGWYLLGVGIGVFLLMFVFGDRELQCSYFPNDRVLADLQKKELKYSSDVACIREFLLTEVDSLFFQEAIATSQVDFSYNQRGTDHTCVEYKLDYQRSEGMYTVFVNNCNDSTATFMEVVLPEGVESDCPPVVRPE